MIIKKDQCTAVIDWNWIDDYEDCSYDDSTLAGWLRGAHLEEGNIGNIRQKYY